MKRVTFANFLALVHHLEEDRILEPILVEQVEERIQSLIDAEQLSPTDVILEFV